MNTPNVAILIEFTTINQSAGGNFMSNNIDLPEKMLQSNLLFDCYESLLTEKQREIYTMHYVEDCSLSEIAEANGITPQAVADSLKRVNARFDDYEEKLGLVKKFQSQQQLVKELALLLEEHNPNASQEVKELISKVMQEL